MIIGLDNVFPGRHEPAPAVLQVLSETVAWCLNKSLQYDEPRSRELDPSAILKFPSLAEVDVEVLIQTMRESYHRAVYAINETRSTLVRDTNIEIAGLVAAQSKRQVAALRTIGDCR